MRPFAVTGIIEDGSDRGIDVAMVARTRLEVFKSEGAAISATLVYASGVFVNLLELASFSASLCVGRLVATGFPREALITKPFSIAGVHLMTASLSVADLSPLSPAKFAWWISMTASGKTSFPILQSPLLLRS